MQYFLEAYTVLRFNMHLGSLDHAFLNKTACLTHGLLKFHAIHSIRSDNGGKQISGSTAFLKNTVCPGIIPGSLSFSYMKFAINSPCGIPVITTFCGP